MPGWTVRRREEGDCIFSQLAARRIVLFLWVHYLRRLNLGKLGGTLWLIDVSNHFNLDMAFCCIDFFWIPS
jgi:hypothetical protein